MKNYNEFITEARVSASKLQRAVNKKSYTFDELEDKDKKKLISLTKELADLRADPRARTGALAKQITSASKKIESFAVKFGMSDEELKKAS
ncbi:ipII internal head protein [Yersinia phage vB_YenM_TG1]|uniref:IpII internal head protein n=1 Tax=Yersinia phage vB_YenM_TG1 TaxID=1589265 RepID=A0A0B5A4H2_9CAUD|nr:internal virion protein [Yersinia phage vB_YenM_TG1]AJD81936.1 ipII internal head protein [Yersinia phage vB_YenM_TG1]